MFVRRWRSRTVVAAASAVVLAAAGGLVLTEVASNAAAGTVQGQLETHVADAGKPTDFTLRGWALDTARSSSPTRIDVTDNGAALVSAFTTVERVDVNRAKRVSGRHGFSIVVKLPARTQHRICVSARAVSGSEKRQLRQGCFTVPAGAPIDGRFEKVFSESPIEGAHTVKGWTFDGRARGEATLVDVEVDGKPVVVSTTIVPRPDVNRAFGLTGAHGFEIPVAVVPDQAHQVCVYGSTADAARRYLLACRTLPASPLSTIKGKVENVEPVSGTNDYLVTGWTLDTASPAEAASVLALDLYYADDLIVNEQTAVERPDVNRAFGTTGAHGFSFQLTLDPSADHVLCFLGMKVNGGSARVLRDGCGEIAATVGQAAGAANPKVAQGKVTQRKVAASAETVAPTGEIAAAIRAHAFVADAR